MKILHNQEIPAGPIKGWSEKVRNMSVGDCVECETPDDAHSMCVAIRQEGFRPVRRKKVTYRVWLMEADPDTPPELQDINDL